MTIRKTDEDAYFAASNSAGGFFSYYPQCFDASRIRHVYAVKGGPGTGKSRFLRDVAKCAEGLGWKSEYIYCSSDPDSLDGVILTGKKDCIALLDATAPHVYEPTRPGVREDIVNLGSFWNVDILAEHASEIEALNAQKSAAYRQAYRFLAGLGNMTRTRDELVAPFVRREAIGRFAERLMRDIPDGMAYIARPALMSSVGMRGEVSFDTYFRQAKRLYLIEDCRGSAQYLMDALGEIAVRKRLDMRLSHDPIEPEKIDAMLLCESGTAFVAVSPSHTCSYPHRTVSMRRFVETARMRSIRAALIYTERMRRAMLDGAIERMERIRETHFRIEEIYISAMDFDAKENFTKSFCDRLFDLQNS